MPLDRLMVFTDFTLASSVAATHCYQIATLSGSEVIALHVISDNEDLEWAEKKSSEQISNIVNYDKSIRFKPLASGQSLFSGMNKWLEDQQVGLTFMATHGKKDLQFVTGSSALKLIFNSEAPMVVVQQHTPLRPYKHILVPLFSHQAEMQFPVDVLRSIIRLFGSKITLLTPSFANDRESEEMLRTIAWIKGILQVDAPAIDVRSSDEAGKNFSRAVLSAVNAEGVDLIAVMIGAKHHREEAEKWKKFYQKVITNEAGVPVLCL